MWNAIYKLVEWCKSLNGSWFIFSLVPEIKAKGAGFSHCFSTYPWLAKIYPDQAPHIVLFFLATRWTCCISGSAWTIDEYKSASCPRIQRWGEDFSQESVGTIFCPFKILNYQNCVRRPLVFLNPAKSLSLPPLSSWQKCIDRFHVTSHAFRSPYWWTTFGAKF